MSQQPNPEVRPKGTRRRFSISYKSQIVQKAAQCQHGELGALLRREGLYHSQLAAWRKALAEDELGTKPRGPKPNPASAEIKRLEREKARLQKKLAQAEAIIDAQKKLALLVAQMQAEAEIEEWHLSKI